MAGDPLGRVWVDETSPLGDTEFVVGGRVGPSFPSLLFFVLGEWCSKCLVRGTGARGASGALGWVRGVEEVVGVRSVGVGRRGGGTPAGGRVRPHRRG